MTERLNVTTMSAHVGSIEVLMTSDFGILEIFFPATVTNQNHFASWSVLDCLPVCKSAVEGIVIVH